MSYVDDWEERFDEGATEALSIALQFLAIAIAVLAVPFALWQLFAALLGAR